MVYLSGAVAERVSRPGKMDIGEPNLRAQHSTSRRPRKTIVKIGYETNVFGDSPRTRE